MEARHAYLCLRLRKRLHENLKKNSNADDKVLFERKQMNGFEMIKMHVVVAVACEITQP